MGLKIITAATTEPLSLPEAKQYLRVDGEDNDTIIGSLIKQAREFCEDYQGKRLITQTLELVLDAFPTKSFIEFKNCSPVQSITSVKYTDYLNAESTMTATDYYLDNDSFVNRLVLAYNKQWPTNILKPTNGVRIRFVCGYGVAAAVPETVKQAMVLQMKLLYDDYRPEERDRIERARNALLGMNRVVQV